MNNQENKTAERYLKDKMASTFVMLGNSSLKREVIDAMEEYAQLLVTQKEKEERVKYLEVYEHKKEIEKERDQIKAHLDFLTIVNNETVEVVKQRDHELEQKDKEIESLKIENSNAHIRNLKLDASLEEAKKENTIKIELIRKAWKDGEITGEVAFEDKWPITKINQELEDYIIENKFVSVSTEKEELNKEIGDFLNG